MKYPMFAALPLFALCALLGTGCTVMNPPPPLPDGNSAEGATPEDAAEIHLGHALLQTIQENDYAAFAKLLAGKTSFDINRKDFETSYESVSKKYGKLTSFTPLTSLKTLLVKNLVWKVVFVKQDQNGNEVEQELLFRLVTGTDDSGTKVLALGFF